MTVDQTMQQAAEGVRQATNDLVAPDLGTVLHTRVVRRRRRVLAVGTGCVALLTAVAVMAATGGERSSLDVIAGRPEAGPCSLLSTADVEAALGAQVLEVERVASIGETEKRLCSYRTDGEVGTITVHHELEAAARYWDEKDRYFRTYPGSAVDIDGVGDAAYLSGGVALTALKGSTVVGISAQRYAPSAVAKLTRLAKTALTRVAATTTGDAASPITRGSLTVKHVPSGFVDVPEAVNAGMETAFGAGAEQIFLTRRVNGPDSQGRVVNSKDPYISIVLTRDANEMLRIARNVADLKASVPLERSGAVIAGRAVEWSSRLATLSGTDFVVRSSADGTASHISWSPAAGVALQVTAVGLPWADALQVADGVEATR